jgi:5'-nucleotidase
MDGVLCDFQSAFDRDRSIWLDQPFPQSKPHFYRELVPIENALESIKTLSSLPDFNIFILTAPSIYNPLSYTEKRLWVEDNLGFTWVDKLIISPDKSLLRGDVLIDDHIRGHGQEKFNGRLIHFNSEEFPDWSHIIEHFMG